MKKIIYALLVVITLGFSFSSCTDEAIEPVGGGDNGGGGVIFDPIKP